MVDDFRAGFADIGYSEGIVTIYGEGDTSIIEDVYIGDCTLETPDGETGFGRTLRGGADSGQKPGH